MKARRILSLWLTVLLLLCSGVAGSAEESETYILNNNGEPMTCRYFIGQMHLEEGVTAEVSRDGQPLNPDELVATGQVLQIINEGGVVTTIQTIVVLGDVLGTGEAGLPQVTRIAAALNGTAPLTGVYAAAADITGSGQIDLGDLLAAVAQMHDLLIQHTIETRPVELYSSASAQPADSLQLCFIDGQNDIPYVSVEDAFEFLEPFFPILGGSISASDLHSDVVLIRREPCEAYVEINFRDSTVLFTDYDLFYAKAEGASILDPVTGFTGPDGEARFIKRMPEESIQRLGLAISLDLKSYDIDLVYQDGMGYLPWQTFNDLFIYPSCRINVPYNGKALFMCSGGDLGASEDAFYSVEPGPRSKALADYTYNELCLLLDTSYGLKEQHNITKFNTLFLQTGLADKLLGTDPVAADDALCELIFGYFADGHSTMISKSPYAGKDAPMSSPLSFPGMAEMIQRMQQMGAARAAVYPDGVPGYEEIGDTAYVTFDSFVWDTTADYSKPPESLSDVTDTVGLIMYAHAQITREDSPIRNVVMDLSNNGGGQVDAAVMTIGWFLGGKASISLNSSLTEAQATTTYRVDINCDGEFDESDSVASLKRYCLIAAPSFSCGNLVPAAFKGSGEVTLMGRNTGGGACVVQHACTASGTLFQISSPLQISTVSNGSYYDADKGILPDVPITQNEHFYERDALTQYISGLFR